MVAVVQSTPRSKGGEIELHNRLGAYVGVMTSVVPGSSTYLGTLALSYSRDVGLVAVRVRASAASFVSTAMRARREATNAFPSSRSTR